MMNARAGGRGIVLSALFPRNRATTYSLATHAGSGHVSPIGWRPEPWYWAEADQSSRTILLAPYVAPRDEIPFPNKEACGRSHQFIPLSSPFSDPGPHKQVPMEVMVLVRFSPSLATRIVNFCGVVLKNNKYSFSFPSCNVFILGLIAMRRWLYPSSLNNRPVKWCRGMQEICN